MAIFKKVKIDRILALIVFACLVISAVYMAVMLIIAPSGPAGEEFANVKSTYILNMLQCVLGAVAMFLPSIVSKRLKFEIPNFFYILFIIFLFCAIYLGEVQNFYYHVPHWDDVLHSLSSMMLASFAIYVVLLLNDHKDISVHLSPAFVAIFAFCFALALGAVWEIYEFTGDHFLDLNMQKYADEDGVLLAGRLALNDTMKDIIVDAVGACVVSTIGGITIKRKRLLANVRRENGDNKPA